MWSLGAERGKGKDERRKACGLLVLNYYLIETWGQPGREEGGEESLRGADLSLGGGGSVPSVPSDQGVRGAKGLGLPLREPDIWGLLSIQVPPQHHLIKAHFNTRTTLAMDTI